jgi:hypothetical protein
MWMLFKNNTLQPVLFHELEDILPLINKQDSFTIKFATVHVKPDPKGLNKEKAEPLIPLSRYVEDEN